MADGDQSLKEIELCLRFFHPLHFSQQVEQLSSMAVLHTKDEAVWCLETHEKLCNEGMPITFFQYFSLALDYILFLILYYESFVDDLHSH